MDHWRTNKELLADSLARAYADEPEADERFAQLIRQIQKQDESVRAERFQTA